MNLCTIDWMALAVWIGALGTVALAYFAYHGLETWRTQFLKQRDHDLALSVVRAISHSYVIFDELRSPVPLFSDSDVPVAPPEAIGPDPDFQCESASSFDPPSASNFDPLQFNVLL